MRILFLCNKSPWPPKEGGPMAMNMLIEGLASSGHEVRVLAVNSFKYHVQADDIPPGYRLMTGIELIDVDLRVKPFPALLNLFTSKSYHAERFISDRFTRRLTEILHSQDFDIVQLETVLMASYIHVIRQHSKARIVLRAHNIEHQIWERLAANEKSPLKRWYLSHLSRTLKLFELTSADLADGVAAITSRDASFFRGYCEKPVISLPFGINPGDYRTDSVSNEKPTLFIIGAMNWMPNAEGVGWFLRNVWIDLHKKYPWLEFRIAGREMPQWMRKLDLPNVKVLGEVEDAAAFFAGNDIMIVPLFSGSGIRVKVIEAMAYGKAVISTALGAEGIDYTNGDNILIADQACEFYEMISLCVERPELRNKTGAKARQLIVNSYNSKKIIEDLLAFYSKLIP
jgi:glycosyltransferase involved in cell wall biosynthesis